MDVICGMACRHTAIIGKSLELGSGTEEPRDEAKAGTWKESKIQVLGESFQALD